MVDLTDFLVLVQVLSQLYYKLKSVTNRSGNEKKGQKKKKKKKVNSRVSNV